MGKGLLRAARSRAAVRSSDRFGGLRRVAAALSLGGQTKRIPETLSLTERSAIIVQGSTSALTQRHLNPRERFWPDLFARKPFKSALFRRTTAISVRHFKGLSAKLLN